MIGRTSRTDFLINVPSAFKMIEQMIQRQKFLEGKLRRNSLTVNGFYAGSL
jgi:hypothetical protein